VSQDEGQTSVLVIGFAVVVSLAVAMVVNASAAYLTRSGLDSLADGAALAAGNGLTEDAVYRNGLGARAALDPAAAQALAGAYLRDMGAAASYPGLRWSVSASEDRVVVRVSAPLDLPFTPPGWQSTPVVTGTAASYVAVGD
jgi:hypothetical protein